MTKHVSITVFGRVQGVFFRQTTQNAALDFNIRGWVRNEADGTVKIEAEGADDDLEKFIDWVRRGPQFSKVDKVEINDGVFKNYQSFDIRR